MRQHYHLLITFLLLILTCNSLTYPQQSAYSAYNINSQYTKDTLSKNYPSIQSNGNIDYVYSGREFTTDPALFDLIQNDETFKKIPKFIQLGPPKLELSYLLQLDGQLDHDLFVSYYLMKEPEFPGKYSIEIRKNTSTLRFGNQNLSFKDRPFLQTDRSFEGIQFETDQKNWDGILAVGKSKSKPEKYESYANQTSVFHLGNSFILEGSEKVYINNRPISTQDYIINYIQGSLTFSQSLKPSDVVKVIYQYTNPIEDFIPTLSNKSLLGYQFEWDPQSKEKKHIFLTKSHHNTIRLNSTHLFWTSSTLSLPREHYNPQNITIKNDTTTLADGVDFILKADNYIHFFYPKFNINESLIISYDYVDSEQIIDTISVTSPQGPYYLLYGNIVSDTVEVFLDNYKAREFVDYIIDEKSGLLFFTYPIPKNSNLSVHYTYLKEYIKNETVSDSKISFRSSYLEEKSKNNQQNIQITTDTINSSQKEIIDGRQMIQLSQTGINLDTKIQFSDPTLENANITIDSYKGQLFFDIATQLPNSFSVTYEHFKFFTGYYSFYASGLARYDSRLQQYAPPSLPIAFNGIYKIVISENSQEKYIFNRENIGKELLINYEDNGQYFTIDFLLGQYSLLDTYPKPSQLITIYYQYDSSQLSPSFDNNHNILDLGLTYRPAEHWTIDTDFAKSSINSQSKDSTVSQEFTSDNRSTFYPLNTEGLTIKQGSETILVNGITRQNYQHYSIDYINGRLRFIEPIPTGSPIIVQFKVLDDVLPIKQEANAYSVKSLYKSRSNKHLMIENSVHTISPNFIPLGELQYTPGESLIENSLIWSKSPQQSFKLNHQSQLFDDKSSKNQEKSHSIFSQLNMPILTINTSQIVNYEKHALQPTIINPTGLTALTTFNKDSLSAIKTNRIEYSPSIYLGPAHRQLMIGSILSKEQLENNSNESSIITYRSLFSTLSYQVLNPPIISSLTIQPRIRLSQENSSIYELYTAQKREDSLGFSYNSILTNGLSNDGSFYRNSIRFKRQNRTITDITKNYDTFLKYTPSYWFNSHYKLKHTEDFGPIIGQEYLVNDTKQFSINKFNPNPLIKKLTQNNFFTPYFSDTYLTGSINDTLRRENNKKTRSTTQYKTGAIHQVSLSPNFLINYLRFSRNINEIRDTNISSYQSLYHSDYYQRSWGLQTTYDIPYRFLHLLTHHYSTQQALIKSDSITESPSGSTRLNTNLNELNFKHHLVLKPHTFQFFNVPLHKTKAYLLWHKQSQVNQTLTQQDKDSRYLDDFNLKKLEFNIFSSAFNMIDQDTTLTLNKDYFNRNKQSQESGSLFKDSHTILHAITFSPTASSDIHTELYQHKLSQFSSSDLNLSPSDLKNGHTQLDYKQNKVFFEYSFLIYNSITTHLGTTFFTIKQQLIPDQTTSKFVAKAYSPGLSWSPLLGLTLRYDYTFHDISKNKERFDGDSQLISLEYNPIHYQNTNVTILMTQENYKGFGFNSIETELNQQESGLFVEQSIRERNDSVFKTSLNISVDLPLSNYRYLETLKITGEGYFKTITDKHIESNNFDISGFYLQASILL